MRNSSVKQCHPGRAYLEVASVGAGESLLWKQAIYADRKEAHTGHRLKREQHRRDWIVVIDRSIALAEVQKKYLVHFFFLSCTFFPPRLHVSSSFFLVSTGEGKKTCCNKWQHGRREITVRGLIGGELVAEVERESEGRRGQKAPHLLLENQSMMTSLTMRVIWFISSHFCALNASGEEKDTVLMQGIFECTVSRVLQEGEEKMFDCSGWIMASTANITHGWLWL